MGKNRNLQNIIGSNVLNSERQQKKFFYYSMDSRKTEKPSPIPKTKNKGSAIHQHFDK